MSQTELALKVGYKDKTMISHIENGKIDLPTTKLADIAMALGVTPGYLMGWEDIDGNSLIDEPKDEETARALDLYELYKNARPEVQAAIDSLLKLSGQD